MPYTRHAVAYFLIRFYVKMEDKIMEFENKISSIIEKQKHIALIAHDSKKKQLVKWADKNKDILKEHFLCGTGTTARLIANETGLPIKAFKSGPLGGDQQIGAQIVEGEVDFVIFFWDPLESQPHDPDVKALLRIAVVYDIPIANNQATADYLLTSKFMSTEYEHYIEDYNKTISSRLEKFEEEL